jgi:hypothetical protein
MRAPVPLDDDNVRILKKTVIAKRNTRATAAAAKKRVTQKGKKISSPARRTGETIVSPVESV